MKYLFLLIVLISLNTISYAFIWPISGNYTSDNITSYYGPRSDHMVINKNHQGLDLKADHVNVYPIRYGKVVMCEWFGRAGYTVKVRSDSFSIDHKYMHLEDESCTVSLNDYVDPQNVLAISGETGSPGSPHLHLQIEEGNFTNQVHPLKYLPYTQGDYISHRVMEKDDESFIIKFITTPPFVDIDQIRFTIMQANNIPVDCVIALSPYNKYLLNPSNSYTTNPVLPRKHPIGNTAWTNELKIDKKECI